MSLARRQVRTETIASTTRSVGRLLSAWGSYRCRFNGMLEIQAEGIELDLRRHKLRSRKALSVSLSSVILAATLLIAALISSFLANNMIEMQSQMVEFDQGRDAYLLLATNIEDVALKPLSAAYVMINSRAGGPSFDTGVGNIHVSIGPIGWEPLQDAIGSATADLNILRYRGGYLVSASAFEYFRGSSSLIVGGASAPLVAVSVNQSGGAWVTLQAGRVRVVNHGSFKLLEGTEFKKYNVIEVTFIRLVPPANVNATALGGSLTGRVYIKAECQNITSVSYMFSDNSIGLTVTATPPGSTESITISGDMTAAGSVVTFVLAEVAISYL